MTSIFLGPVNIRSLSTSDSVNGNVKPVDFDLNLIVPNNSLPCSPIPGCLGFLWPVPSRGPGRGCPEGLPGNGRGGPRIWTCSGGGSSCGVDVLASGSSWRWGSGSTQGRRQCGRHRAAHSGVWEPGRIHTRIQVWGNEDCADVPRQVLPPSLYPGLTQHLVFLPSHSL